MPEKKTSCAAATRPRDEPATADGQNVTATFCFVDIAGYTALTDSHGERAAADLVDEFTRLIHSAVEARGDVQEFVGDQAFLVFPDPLAALAVIRALYLDVAGLWDFPKLRTGIHHGPALYRSRRYFGSTINMAARTAAHAGGGEILCTAPVAEALAGAHCPTLSINPIGKVKLKNLPREVDLYRIGLKDLTDRRVVDPVCHMQVDVKTAAAHQSFNARHYWFCSAACSERFAANPSDFV